MRYGFAEIKALFNVLFIKYFNFIKWKQVSDIHNNFKHTAPEQNLGLKKIAIKTKSAEMWRMIIRSF